MPYSILGLHGWAGSGKTTTKQAVAKFVSKFENDNNIKNTLKIHQLAFADPVKKVCIAMFGEAPNWYGTQEQKNEKIPLLEDSFKHIGIETFRDAMKYIGTEVFREHMDPDVWVKLLRLKMKQILAQEYYASARNLFIIDDVRFENEASFILGTSGAVIRILKSGQTSIDPHKSEQSLSEPLLTKTLEFAGPDDIHASAGYIYSIAIGNAK